MHTLWQHVFSILGAYRNELPLHHYLKAYYKKFPILGSRDRKGINDAVYAWYRCGKAFSADAHSREEQLLAALLLCGLRPKAFFKAFPTEWTVAFTLDVSERLALLRASGFHVDLALITPFAVTYSEGITADQFQRSVLQHPHLFLRIRRRKEQVAAPLAKSGIPFQWQSDTCLSLPNGTSLAGLLPEDTYVIQDASSQETGRYFKPAAKEVWWDCCAGAGGKSLLLKDLQPDVTLWVSDVRATILENLKARFRLYRVTQPHALVLDAADATSVENALGSSLFDGILCDVPCTGSGTWGRTPEGLYFFDPQMLKAYSERGTAILRHAAARLKPGGRVVYMTCSVFEAENEAVVRQVLSETALQLSELRLINGIDQGADVLFVAVLQAPAA